MKPLRRGGLAAVLSAILAIGLLAAGALAWIGRGTDQELPPRQPSQRPALMMVTSLPLIFPEEFGLNNFGSPTLEALESRYKVEPIGVADAQSLEQGDLLLMAHPLAQPAEALVELDSWVRQGGRVLILADPRLDWPSERPLGDLHRPPPYYADTGLLGHWGLRLDAPEEPGPQEHVVDGRRVRTGSPGSLSGSCETLGEGLVARCSIGRGRATVIADADLLQPAGASPEQAESNLQFLLSELERLEQ